MAVVSISKIQVRQGKKNSDEGVPQLSSGEFGWAIDAQELYIGNGSVADGAPMVGNTRILTEGDNIFEISKEYEYLSGEVQTGVNFDEPIERSLQERLDESVSSAAFGITGSGFDESDKIQLAMDSLFLNRDMDEAGNRITLNFLPGRYVVDKTIEIPPHAILIGSGVNQTIFESSGDFPVFSLVPDKNIDFNEASYSTQSRSLTMEDFAIVSDGGGIRMRDCRDSSFKNIKITNRNDVNAWGFKLSSTGSESGVSVNNNTFESVQVLQSVYGFLSTSGIFNNKWINNYFEVVDEGIVLQTGPSPSTKNTIFSSRFVDVKYSAISIFNGRDNTSSNNQFVQVGYGGYYSAFVSDHHSNASIDDYFSDQSLYSDVASPLTPVPIQSKMIRQSSYTQSTNTPPGTTPSNIVKLPVSGKMGYVVDYIYQSPINEITRSGRLNFSLDTEMDTTQPISIRRNVSISDEYDFLGDSVSGESIVFDGKLIDSNSDGEVDALVISMTNTNLSDDGEIHFQIKTKS